jgi:NADH:ubiquinone oxidoreductase subunit 6 (subunit J)
MRKVIFLIASLMMVLVSCDNEGSSSQSIETEGYNMLLIGNSFFKPYAEKT